MRVITRASLAAEAADNFELFFVRMRTRPSKKDRERLKAVRALGPAPDPDRVNEALGRNWTRVPSCAECAAEPPSVTVLAEKYVCGECLIRALNLLEGDA